MHKAIYLRPHLTRRAHRMFYADVRKTETCWVWHGQLWPNGYGYFKIAGTAVAAHRVAYAFRHATIPDDLVLDHLCRNRACVRPSHLQPVTPEENIRRGAVSRKAEKLLKGAVSFGLPAFPRQGQPNTPTPFLSKA